MEIIQIKAELAARAEQIAQQLLPQGKRKGAEWCVGEKSGSLRVHLTGSKAGIWKDFADGEKGGDLLDLYCSTTGATLREALTWARELLGVTEPQFARDIPKRVFRKPEVSKAITPTKQQSHVMEYLTKTRGLSLETIRKLKIAEMPSRKFNGDHTCPAVVFPFKSPTGDLLFLKYLGIDRPEGKKLISAEADCQPSLFGWQAMAPNSRMVVICEGELSAASWHQYGAGALATPFGAGGGRKQDWVEHEWENLQQFETIYLDFDQDKPGREAVETLVERLGRHRCLVVPPKPNGLKDINDCLLAGIPEDDILQLLHKAKSCDPPELRSAEDFVEEVKEEFYPTNETKGLEMPFPGLKGKFEVRMGELTIVTGFTGHGKSQFLGMLVLFLMLAGQRCLIASFEMRARKTLARMTRQVTALRRPERGLIDKVFQWFAGKLWIFDHVGAAEPKKIFEIFDYARRRYGVRIFVLDSLMKCGLREDDYEGQTLFADKLANYANEHSVHIFLVAHPRKANDDTASPGTQGIKGSNSLSNHAHNILSYFRNKLKEIAQSKMATNDVLTKEEEKALERSDATLTTEKQREGDGWVGSIRLAFDNDSQQMREDNGKCEFKPIVPLSKLGWEQNEYPQF